MLNISIIDYYYSKQKTLAKTFDFEKQVALLILTAQNKRLAKICSLTTDASCVQRTVQTRDNIPTV